MMTVPVEGQPQWDRLLTQPVPFLILGHQKYTTFRYAAVV